MKKKLLLIGFIFLGVFLTGCGTYIISPSGDIGKLEAKEDIYLEAVDFFDFNLEDWDSKENKNIDDDFCKNQKNYNYWNFFIEDSQKDDKELKEWSTGKWYPSLKEGEIKGYYVTIHNSGCTKLDITHFYTDFYLYYNDELLTVNKKSTINPSSLKLQDRHILYPAQIDSLYSSSNEEIFDGYKINKPGKYTIKVAVYFDKEKIGTFDKEYVLP